MNIREYEELKEKTTLRVGGTARYFIKTDAVDKAVSFANQKQLPLITLGGGSNVLLPDGVLDAVVLSPSHTGIEIVSENKDAVTIRIGGSESLDNFIAHTVSQGWWGLENLSLIPGTVAGLAIQNVGAYGAKAASYINSVDVYDTHKDTYTTISNSECNFSYRASIFNTTQKDRYIVTHLALTLSKQPNPILSYRGMGSLGENPTQDAIRDHVIAVRKGKDLEPERVWSVGSFFKNVEMEDISMLPKEIQDKTFKTNYGYKIPSGALIEGAQLKGFCIGGACVSETQANMLINKGDATSKDFQRLYEYVVKEINSLYGITLIHEPEFIAIS